MKQQFTRSELGKIHRILKAFDEGLIRNPDEDWEADHYDRPLAERGGVAEILRKIERMLPPEDTEEMKKDILRRKYDTYHSEVDDAVYGTLRRAFGERRTVEIGYFDQRSAEVRQRRIDIYHTTAKYTLAYCHLRKAMRKFRTGRIVSARLTGRRYRIPADFDKNEY